jgi:hypothetical protein
MSQQAVATTQLDVLTDGEYDELIRLALALEEQ